jgi:hypothetical protein
MTSKAPSGPLKAMKDTFKKLFILIDPTKGSNHIYVVILGNYLTREWRTVLKAG